MTLAPHTAIREIRHAHLFCGIGVGALALTIDNDQAAFRMDAQGGR